MHSKLRRIFIEWTIHIIVAFNYPLSKRSCLSFFFNKNKNRQGFLIDVNDLTKFLFILFMQPILTICSRLFSAWYYKFGGVLWLRDGGKELNEQRCLWFWGSPIAGRDCIWSPPITEPRIGGWAACFLLGCAFPWGLHDKSNSRFRLADAELASCPGLTHEAFLIPQPSSYFIDSLQTPSEKEIYLGLV